MPRLLARTILAAAVLAFAASHELCADVTLPALISDNMVLQQWTKASVWGTAEPGERVTVSVAGRRASAPAGSDGRWAVKLSSLKPGGPYEMTVSGKNTLVIKNVAVGEVWVGSGQSNMEWKVANSKDAAQEIAAANFPMLRMFSVGKKVTDEPQPDTSGKWEICTPQTAGGFSAVGYFFGRELHKELKAPVGIIHASWGGTPAQSWTPQADLEKTPELAPILEKWREELEKHPEAQARFEEKLAAWNAEAAKAKAEGKPAPRRPTAPRGPGHAWTPAGLYNGMIAPLLPCTIRGVIWYQGESNTENPREYRTLFPTLITAWRKAWGQGNFPFLFVQLANFMARQPEPSESRWAELREAQAMALKLPRTGMAVAIDIGDEKNMHPGNKQEVGRRLALVALSSVYGKKKVVSSGPVFAGMNVAGGKVRLNFNHAGAGLEDKDGPPLKGFAVAGEDRRFVWADAQIQGNAVVVESNGVPKPVAVRYGWADSPEADLYNKAGLPAVPFRTDAWERPGLSSPEPAAE